MPNGANVIVLKLLCGKLIAGPTLSDLVTIQAACKWLMRKKIKVRIIPVPVSVSVSVSVSLKVSISINEG